MRVISIESINIRMEIPPYLFGGKERDEMLGINLMNFEARSLDDFGRFTTVDPLAEKYYSISPYAYCGNNPIMRTDPTGMWLMDDIEITGENNSSLTIKTDVVDIKISTGIDFKGNHTIADISNVAIGFEEGVDLTAAAGVGTSFNGYTTSALFLGGDYAGYWYDYLGGEAQVVGTSSLDVSAGAHKNWFIAVNKDNAKNNPKGFAGKYFGVNLSASFKAIGGLSVNGQWSRSEDRSWSVLSLGLSASTGFQAGAFVGFSATASGTVGGLKLLTPLKPTSERGFLDRISNWATHLLQAL